MNKKKIINDPIYGFVGLYNDLIFDLVSHTYFQRLRRIRQLGLAEYVYPGALHTRFHHAIGAMHLMQSTLDSLRAKGHHISEAEYEAALIAILLHDIGHGPFSHVLEKTILDGVHHEDISLLFMQKLNEEFNGALSLAISVFSDTYPRRFLHQLVSSQLDMDRLDYLQRDCFFTGVSEGTVAADRLIKMLDIHKGEIVVEQKGIYSVENFLTARRLMYWQVYLHKTSLAAERMLVHLIRRAKELSGQGQKVPSSGALGVFLNQNVSAADFAADPFFLRSFARLDDFDIWAAIKEWAGHNDKVLSDLSQRLLDRRLFKVYLQNEPFTEREVSLKREATIRKHHLSEEEAGYYFVSKSISNAGYMPQNETIKIKMQDGRILDAADASDLPSIKALGNVVTKYYMCCLG